MSSFSGRFVSATESAYRIRRSHVVHRFDPGADLIEDLAHFVERRLRIGLRMNLEPGFE